MVVKDGYRFIQGLLPAKMHRDFTELSRKLGKSRSEMLRNAIDAYLSNKKDCKTSIGALDNEN